MYMPLGFWGEGPGLLLKTFCLMSMAVFLFVLLPWKKGFWVNWSVNWFPALALVECEHSKWRSLVLLLQKAQGFYFLFELAASGLTIPHCVMEAVRSSMLPPSHYLWRCRELVTCRSDGPSWVLFRLSPVKYLSHWEAGWKHCSVGSGEMVGRWLSQYSSI